MTFHHRFNHHRPSENDHRGMVTNMMSPDNDDKSSLEAAAEAAAKVDAMLIAKGMLKPNQIHNIVTKKIGGPNSLVVGEVEINDLPLPCRNTLTRGTTQEEISKASGASVTTRGRYMTEDERARNPRDRCLYLNIQASKKESVDIAVEKINQIIKSMGGDKMNARGAGWPGFHGGGRFRSPPRPNFNNPRFAGKNQIVPQLHPHPPPLMSLPTPQQLQQPPPHLPHILPQQLHIPPPPPATVQVTVVQEKLYVGLEHAPPNFDTKNKLLGPVGSFLQHIQNGTGASVSLRGKGSGFMDLNGADAFEPMHIHIEHSALPQLQEAKKLAENLIQTVQQSYVSFQQALAALPPSMPTGLITGVPQQPPLIEHHQLTVAQSGLPTIATVQEQPLQPMQPQALANTAGGQAVVIPSSMTLQMPMVTSLVSAPPPMMQQAAPLDLVGQQPVLINHPQAPPPQAIVQQVVPNPGQPQPVPPPTPAPMATAYGPVQQTVQLVSQAPPSIVQQPTPALLAQAPPQVFPPQPIQSFSASVAAPSSVVYTVASNSGHAYYSTFKDEGKRRFREEKDDKIPDNLLGYQHGPPHLVNLVRSSPPLQPQPVPPPPPMSQGMGTQLLQQPPHGVVMSHIPPPGLEHIGGQLPLVSVPPLECLQQPQLLSQSQQPGPPGHPGLPPHQFMSATPLHHHLPPPHSSPTYVSSFSPSHCLSTSPNGEIRPHSRNDKSLMPPPPPPSGLGSPTEDGNNEEHIKTEETTETGGKRKSNGFNSEPEKKKIKGILKNKREKSQDGEGEERRNHHEQSSDDEQDKKHPASPQYQGQPLRYPSMPSDPNVPPQLQEMGIHGQRPPHPPMPPSILTSHPLVQPSDPNLPPHFQHAPHPQHIHIEGQRPEGPPPGQILIEHAVPHGAPIQFTHHRPPGLPASITMEQHGIPGGPLPPRPLLLEHHPHPVPTPHQLEQHIPQPALQPDPMQIPTQHPVPPQGMPLQTQPPQEVLEVHPPRPPPQFQGFEPIPVSALSQPEPQTMLQPAVIAMSSASQYIPYSMAAISSQTASISQASFSVTHTSGQIPVYSQPMQQRMQEQPQIMAAPPPPVPQSSYNVGVPPNSSPHFQAQFSHPAQPVQGQVLPPLPPSMPMASQQQFHQPQPQGIQYWTP